MNLYCVVAIARKDLLDAVRNLYLLSGLLLPIGVWALFQLMMPGGDVRLGPVAAYDPGQSRLVQRLRADPQLRDFQVVSEESGLREAVQKGTIVGLAVPVGFDAALLENRNPELPLFVDSSRGGGAASSFRRLLEDHLRSLAGQTAPAQLRVVDVAGGTAAPASAPGKGFELGILVLLGLAMTGVFAVPTLLVEEKERRTLKVVLVSPASYVDVVAGKALAGLGYSMLGAAVVVVLDDGLRGNVGLLAAAVALGALALVEVGLLMGAVFDSTAHVNTWSSVLLVVLLLPTMLAFSPVPEPLRLSLRLLPTYYLNEAIAAAGRGESAMGSLPSLAFLAGFVVLFFALIAWSLRRQEK